MTSTRKTGGTKVKSGTGHGRGHGRAPPAARGAAGSAGRAARKGGHDAEPRGRPGGARAGRRRPRRARPAADAASRPLRHEQIDAAVLEVHGLVHDQGWLADRALERALRDARLFAVRAARRRRVGLRHHPLAGAARLAAGAPPAARPPDLATRYAAWLVRFGGLGGDEAARRLGVPAAALRRLGEAEARLGALADPVERLALRGSLPFWLARRFIEELGEAEATALVGVLNDRAPLTIRANLLRGTREALQATLAAEGTRATPTRFSPWGLTLDGHQNAFALASFKAGRFEIQDEGSQLIALCCGARPGWTVVDACAGAGGKALALAAEMRNRGTLWALDSDAGRLDEARRRARRDGVDNLRVRAIAADEAADAQLDDLAGRADVVLIDAPCSGLGTLRRKPDVRWRLAPGDPEKFAALQKTLAARFSRLVKPGGRLVYATCAIGRTENEAVAEHLAATLPFDPAPLAPLLGAERAAALGRGRPHPAAPAPPARHRRLLHGRLHAAEGLSPPRRGRHARAPRGRVGGAAARAAGWSAGGWRRWPAIRGPAASSGPAARPPSPARCAAPGWRRWPATASSCSSRSQTGARAARRQRPPRHDRQVGGDAPPARRRRPTPGSRSGSTTAGGSTTPTRGCSGACGWCRGPGSTSGPTSPRSARTRWPSPSTSSGSAARLRATRRAVKVALLDQGLLAGVGNIHASEACWRARLDPRRRGDSLTPAEVARLARAVRASLRFGLAGLRRCRRSSTWRRAGENPFHVYDREGRRCRHRGCGGAVERLVQAQRSTFFCRRCQE